MKNSSHKPFVPASVEMPEVTLRAVVLGSVLGVVLGAANAYLGLYAGMTVSASIPAAVLSMGILRGVLRRGTILENNIVQTIAASGEALAAGVIFTIPALLITGVWLDVQFWPTTLICVSGGLLGIGFMVPLRRTHIVEDHTLTFPEGTACAEVLKAGDEGGSGARTILAAIAVGGLLKFFVGGVSLLRGTVEWAFQLGRTPFYFGADISAALLGVGYIVGLRIAALVFLGGVITWGVAIPLTGEPGAESNLLEWFTSEWSSQARYIGVGAMMIGGVWSILAIGGKLLRGLRESVAAYRQRASLESPHSQLAPRTERNMRGSHLALLLGFACVLAVALYYHLIGQWSVTLIAAASMLVMSFVFVAVASYIVGLVGSSNSPVSGMTICAVLATAGLLVVLGQTGPEGILATLGVAGVVCCAASSAGDISQDLKTGYLLGATPVRQQWMEVVGAAVSAVVMAPVMTVLHHAYGIGTGEPGSLKAPQATLFASLVEGIFGEGRIPWSYVAAGVGVGAAIIAADQLLRLTKSTFRLPVMAVAVGMYLPLALTAPIFLGGLVAAISRDRRESGSGILFASGLIAGEALVGVLLGLVIYVASLRGYSNVVPVPVFDSSAVSILALVGLAGLLYMVDRRGGARR
jgi:putative OPT family oligopeptide transporter